MLLLPAVAFTAGNAGTSTSREARVATLFDSLSAQPPRLRTFLQPMPKGGDLHNHLVGSVYAEDFLRWADEAGYCLSVADKALKPPPCGVDQVSARGLVQRDATLYSQAIDALSVRNFVPGKPEISGHDRFFSTFGKFIPLATARLADTLVSTLQLAAGDRVSYVEIIVNPTQAYVIGPRAQQRPWAPDDLAANLRGIEGELPAMVKSSMQEFDAAEVAMRKTLRCGTQQADTACDVHFRYLYYVDRAMPQPFAFGEMALGYALVKADARFAGINIVDPEDDPTALADYQAQMRMFEFFSARDPQIRLTLHAGELTLGLVPPSDLRFHIAAAVAIGARRIGHGVDVSYEDNAAALLARMAKEGVAVEINLTSNDVILGVRGRDHPLNLYRAAGVPVVLSTDDEGVSRIDMTNEYVRAATEHGLRYGDLKNIARNALEFSFVPGASLWRELGGYHAVMPACTASLAALHASNEAATDPPAIARAKPDKACSGYLARSEKAQLQWRLERELVEFETQILRTPF